MTDWSQIVRQHGPLVWRTVRRLVSNEADAADCFQRAFVSALVLSRTEKIHNWAALLRRLAMARAIEGLRQRRRESNRLVPLSGDDRALDRGPQPLPAAETHELADHLRTALAELDTQPAQAFCLACLEGFSYQQIAEELGVTVNHVGVLLNRAKAKLRERLQAHAPMPAAENPKREVQP
jgi:RNA polymerase sigma-70 factor, ECF subfamily